MWVSVLESRKDGRRYIGGGENVEERLRRHNVGDYRYTKGHRPWVVIYKERCNSRSDAVKKERFFKTGVGRKQLKEMLSEQC